MSFTDKKDTEYTATALADLYYKDGLFPDSNPYQKGTPQHTAFDKRIRALFADEERASYYANLKGV